MIHQNCSIYVVPRWTTSKRAPVIIRPRDLRVGRRRHTLAVSACALQAVVSVSMCRVPVSYSQESGGLWRLWVFVSQIVSPWDEKSLWIPVTFAALGDQEYSVGSALPSSESWSLCFLWWQWYHHSFQVWSPALDWDWCCAPSDKMHQGTPTQKKGRSRTRKALSGDPSNQNTFNINIIYIVQYPSMVFNMVQPYFVDE